MKEINSEVRLGSWTIIETCLLDALDSYLHCTCFLPTGENVTLLYNHVVKSNLARELGLQVWEKTKKQVEGKLNFENIKGITVRKLAYGVELIN